MTLLGADRADITPPGPVPLAGYAFRAELGPATEVLAPLQLRTLVLGEEGAEPVVIIGADLLWWGTELVRTLRQDVQRSEEHTSELQSRGHLVCRLLLAKKK